MALRSIVLGIAAATFAVSAGLVVVPAAAAEPLPGVVPSVRQAVAGTGSGFTWSGGGRIVVADGSLAADARTFASDLAGLFGEAVPAVVAGGAQAGDISLSLGSADSRLGEEGYGLAIGPVLAISARTPTGAFWGTRTVLQLLRQQRSLPAYTVADWPKFKVRAISVSVEKFPAGWFLNLVRDMSYVKLNELTTGSALSKLSDTQIREIQTVADRYQVKFVGWFNTTHYNPGTVPAEFQLLDQKSRDDPTLVRKSTTLDISKPAAVTWATNQIERYMDLQTAPFWHAGGDEYPEFFLRNEKVSAETAPELHAAATAKYPAEAKPAAALYNEVFNHIDSLARARGKQMRIWNDDLIPTSTVKLNPDVVVDHWINHVPALDPAQLIAAGHHLINSNMDYLYYDEEDGDGLKNTTPAKLWTELDPGRFHGGLQIPGGANNPNLDGIKLNTWHGAHHKPPGLLELDLLRLNRPLAERAWAPSPPSSTLAVAQALFARIGRAPGVVQTPATGDPGATSLPASPAVAYLGSQQVFFVGANGQLRRRYWKAGQTSVLEAAVATTSPVAGRPVAYVAGSQLHVFARGTNGSVQHAWYEPSTNAWAHDDWTAKSGTSATITGDLAGFSYGPHQHVFARGSDGRLRHLFYDAGLQRVGANDWGGSIAGDPVAFVFGRTQSVFAVAADGTLRRWWWQPSDASHLQHQNLGGSFPASARPAGAGFTENAQDVVVRGTDGHLWHWSYNELAGTSTWRDLTAATGFSIAGNPALYIYGMHPNADRHVFFRNAANNHLTHVTLQPSGTASAEDWTTLALGDPTTAVGDPAGFTFANTERHTFATDPAGRLHHWYWLSGDGKVHQDTWPRATQGDLLAS